MGFLAFMYGDDYSNRLLSGELIHFTQDDEAHSARVVVFAINMGVLAMQLAFFDWSKIITKFTNWTLIVTLANLIVTFMCTHGQSGDVLRELAAAQLTFEFGIIMNIVTTCLYWTLIHKGQLIKYKGDTQTPR